MNNFISDFIGDTDNKEANKQIALQEWQKLKKLNIHKNYQAYKDYYGAYVVSSVNK